MTDHSERPMSRGSHAPAQRTERSLVEVLREIWWGQAALGHRMPAERDVILIDGGRS